MKVFTLVLCSCLWSAPTLAVECGEVQATSSDARQRLQHLAATLNAEAEATARWRLIWGGLYGVLTVAQLTVAPALPAEERPDWYWGAAAAATGILFTAVDPPHFLYASSEFSARVSRANPDEVCALLDEGEKLLRSGAAYQIDNTRWYLHAGNVLFNVALGLVLGLGYQHWSSAAINAAAGTAIGELMIFTLPTALKSGVGLRPSGLGLAFSF